MTDNKYIAIVTLVIVFLSFIMPTVVLLYALAWGSSGSIIVNFIDSLFGNPEDALVCWSWLAVLLSMVVSVVCIKRRKYKISSIINISTLIPIIIAYMIYN